LICEATPEPKPSAALKALANPASQRTEWTGGIAVMHYALGIDEWTMDM
jgi:hypothetical protein